jgi:hypothetical protein
MPPRRSARVVAAGEHGAPALAPLPHALVLHILSLLPVDCRLLCAAVCRSWRAALEDRSLWLRLDLSASGVSPSRVVTDALLHAAAARADGQLQALHVDAGMELRDGALLAAVTANGGALRELRICGVHGVTNHSGAVDTDSLEQLLLAAPHLSLCEANVECDDLHAAHRILRNEPPFAPLRVRTFAFAFAGEDAGLDEAAVLALAADLASHAHLRRLRLTFAALNTAAALDAVVDAALTRRLTSVALNRCELSPDSAPALVRLIGGGALAELDICGGGKQLLDFPASLALCNALRASSTLTALSLRWVNLWQDPAVAMVLGAVTGHPSLRSLDISSNPVNAAVQELRAARRSGCCRRACTGGVGHVGHLFG